VRVRHGLASVGAGVEDDPVPVRGNALRHRHLMSLRGHLVQQATARRGDRGKIRQVHSRDHQHVDWSLRIDVTESDSVFTFQHQVRGQVTGGDTAKQTVRHGGILTCTRPSGPLTYMVTLLRTHDAPPLWCGLAKSWLSVAAGAPQRGCRGDAIQEWTGMGGSASVE
jgi:hypothetical protein